MTTTPPQLPTSPDLPRGSQLWFAEKLTSKKDILTYSLVSCAAGRLVWITQFHRLRGLKAAPTVVGPQLVIWAMFWPTALVVLRTGIKWADRAVAKSGLDRPAEGGRAPRAEIEGDARKDI